MGKFLDSTGLGHLISKIKSWGQEKLVSGTNIKTINNSSILGSGNISIEGGIKEISTQYIRITDLAAGVYKLTYNGTKYLYYYGTSNTSNTHTITGSNGAVILHVSKYSTTYWHWWYINGTTGYESIYYGYTYSSGGSVGTSKQLSNLYTGTPTDTKPNYLVHYNTTFKNTSSYSVYRYQILVFNGTGLSAFTNTSSTTGTSKTQLAAKYYPNSPIFYYGSTSTVTINNTFTGSYIYQSYYSIDLRYSFNIGTSTLSVSSPVYIKMSKNSDGTLSPVYSASSGGHPLTNSLPSTADGYVYVYLGNTNSSYSYQLDLEPVHPCFEYKNGKICVYTGSSGAVSDVQVNGTSVLSSGVANIVTETAYNASSNKIATMSDIPSGEVDVTLNGTATSTTHTLSNIVVGTDTYLMPKLYQHTIKFFKTYAGGHPSGCVYFTFLSQSSTAVSTLSGLLTALKNARYDKKNIQASGYYYFSSSNTSKHILAVYPNKDGSYLTAYYFDTSNWSEGSATLITAGMSNYTITDSVIQIM